MTIKLGRLICTTTKRITNWQPFMNSVYGSTYKLTLRNSGSCPRQSEGQPPTSIVDFSIVQIWSSHTTILSSPKFESQCIDGFESCKKMAMLVHKTMANLAHVLHNNRVKFPKFFLSFVLCTSMAGMMSGENHLYVFSWQLATKSPQ